MCPSVRLDAVKAIETSAIRQWNAFFNERTFDHNDDSCKKKRMNDLIGWNSTIMMNIFPPSCRDWSTMKIARREIIDHWAWILLEKFIENNHILLSIIHWNIVLFRSTTIRTTTLVPIIVKTTVIEISFSDRYIRNLVDLKQCRWIWRKNKFFTIILVHHSFVSRRIFQAMKISLKMPWLMIMAVR